MRASCIGIPSKLELVNSNKVLTREEFVKKVDRLFESVPLPPVHNNPTGSYSLITDIPPIVMCDNATADLFEEFIFFLLL